MRDETAIQLKLKNIKKLKL